MLHEAGAYIPTKKSKKEENVSSAEICNNAKPSLEGPAHVQDFDSTATSSGHDEGFLQSTLI